MKCENNHHQDFAHHLQDPEFPLSNIHADKLY
jgi:hypothetical protein